MNDRSQPLVEVFVEESCERWSEFFLSDGTVLRAKILPTQFFRVEGKFDERGLPQYTMGPTSIMWIIRETPEELKQTRN